MNGFNKYHTFPISLFRLLCIAFLAAEESPFVCQYLSQ